MKRRYSVKVDKRKLTLAAQVLLYFFAFAEFIPRPFESKGYYTRRIMGGKTDDYSYYRIMKKLSEKGWIKIYKDGKKKLYSLTKAGQLEALFIKARLPEKAKWDGKWRIIVFDIPEQARSARNKLRNLLKTNGFKMVQKSVFINPYPFNREAIKYLQLTGLDKYIRVFRIDEADNNKQLKKLFSL